MKRVGFSFRGRRIVLEGRLMKGVNRMLGLMLYRDVLIFKFEKGKRAIHSLFCKPFVAVWLRNGRVVEIRRVSSWKCAVKPKKEFDTLVEIPLNPENSKVTKFLLN